VSHGLVQIAPVGEVPPSRRPQHLAQAKDVRVVVTPKVAQDGELTQATAQLQMVTGRAYL
jgi:hypothetical protein